MKPSIFRAAHKNYLSTSYRIQPSYQMRATIFKQCFTLKTKNADINNELGKSSKIAKKLEIFENDL